MVRRPVFVPDSAKPYVYRSCLLDFEQFFWIFYSAEAAFDCEFACVAMWRQFPSSRVLEVSSKSEETLAFS